MPLVKYAWYGRQYDEAGKRALSRGAVAATNEFVSNAKMIVHRDSGTLSRSIHAAPPNYHENQGDESKAASGVDLVDVAGYNFFKWEGDRAHAQAGSWLGYAIYEENLHPYLAPALAMARQTAQHHFDMAFREEGMNI